MSADDLRRMIEQGWTAAKPIGPAERRVRDVMGAGGDPSELSSDDVRALLREVGALRRTWHPLCHRLDLS